MSETTSHYGGIDQGSTNLNRERMINIDVNSKRKQVFVKEGSKEGSVLDANDSLREEGTQRKGSLMDDNSPKSAAKGQNEKDEFGFNTPAMDDNTASVIVKYGTDRGA